MFVSCDPLGIIVPLTYRAPEAKVAAPGISRQSTNLKFEVQPPNLPTSPNEPTAQVRPSAAAICIERSLDRLRYFSNESVPKLKERVQERNNAELNFHSYQRRQASAAKKKPGSKELEHLNSKLEMTSKHFNEINGVLKVLTQ